MNSALLAVLIVLVGSSLVMSANLQATGFRPGKAFHPASHPHAALAPSHHHLMDLEEDKVKSGKKAEAKAKSAPVESKDDQQVEALLQKAASHIQQLEENFLAVKEDVAALRNSEETRLKHAAAKPATAAAPKVAKAAKPALAKAVKAAEPAVAVTEPAAAEVASDDFAAADGDNTASFLQYDDMNEGAVDDEALMPLARRVRTMMTATAVSAASKSRDSSVTFGMSGDGSRRTYDIATDGTPIVHSEVRTMAPDARVNELKVENTTVTPDMDKDVVCVCKRHGAPRGDDRVKCKKHITPTPTPTPTPLPIKGVRQCVNGTWTENSGEDAGISDVICIYDPVNMPLLQLAPPAAPSTPAADGTPTAPASTEPEYPPECYDERNEFVADGVIEKHKFDVVLLQQGFETCGC